MAKSPKKESIKPSEPIEKQLWKAADKLRKNIDAAEYKHIVLGLIFLRYISDAFEGYHSKLKEGKGDLAGADPEDREEYTAENIFFVPKVARWSYLVSIAKQPKVGKYVDEAMDAIEKVNPSLKDVLPKVYARGNLDPVNLGGLVDLIGNIAIHDAKTRSADVLGHVFEYFLGEFALAEGKKGGQFYTPRSVVELLVDMLEPHTGRVFDPCCGSGGMFVQSEKFVAEHQGKVNDIVIYGQESNLTTWRLCKANGRFRNRTNEILFIDARNEGHLINRRTLEFSADDIKKIAGIYHKWRNPKGRYEDIKGFCNSAGIQRVRELDYVLTPGRYVGLPEEKDDFDFKERFTALKAEFEEQLKEEAILNKKILANLARIDLDGGKRRAGEK